MKHTNTFFYLHLSLNMYSSHSNINI